MRSPSPRVLVLTADYPPRVWSGIGTAVERQARALAGRGAEVTVVTPAAPRQPPAVRGRLRVLPLGGDRFPADPARFDVVHLHSLALSELALELCRRFHLPLVYSAHTWIPDELPPGPARDFWSAVQGRVMAASRRVVFVSERCREAALARLPELAPASRVVAHGVAAPSRPHRRGGGAGEGTLLFAGRFAGSKGLDLLAEAAPRILARHRGPLVLAGGHGDAEGERAVERLAAALPGRCRVLGWQSAARLGRLLRQAALLLVPSRWEPFGLVALEAMRVGTPVLAADVGGLGEVAAPGSGGHLVRGRDPGRWAEAALAILDDGRMHRRLSERGPRWVAERYDARALAARMIEEVYAA